MQHDPANSFITDNAPVPPFNDQWALFLDIDGTLTPLQSSPTGVEIDGRAADTLARLQRTTNNAVALITGRSIADADQLLRPLRLPMAGQHGTERRDTKGRYHANTLSRHNLDPARAALHAFAARNTGIVIEDKHRTLALHYRGAPAARNEAESLIAQQVEKLGCDYRLQSGKMVFEIRPNGHDKGTAIKAFLSESPFVGRIPIFIGDDQTDEDGFAIVNRLCGHAIKVGAGATIARWSLPNASAVIDWLTHYADFLERTSK